MYDINIARAEAEELLKEMIDEFHFGEVLSGKKMVCQWEVEHPMNYGHITYTTGCTKIVFWDDDRMDYVFKMSLEPEYIDYCLNEAKIYEMAEEFHLDPYFAWTCPFIFDYNDKTIQLTAMAFCDIDYESLGAESFNYRIQLISQECGLEEREVRDIVLCNKSNPYDICLPSESLYSDAESTDGMLIYAASVWGENEASRVESFCSIFELNDLHCGNWGRCDGRLVITDYSGYRIDISKDWERKVKEARKCLV